MLFIFVHVSKINADIVSMIGEFVTDKAVLEDIGIAFNLLVTLV